MGIKYFESLSEGEHLQCRSVPMMREAIRRSRHEKKMAPSGECYQTPDSVLAG